MAFPQSPYYVIVSGVQLLGADISGTQFKLENITKGTEVLSVSDETDSNIAFNLAELGDWDMDDNIRITASHYGKVASNTHQVVFGDNSEHDFGTLALGDAVISGGRILVNGGLVS